MVVARSEVWESLEDAGEVKDVLAITDCGIVCRINHCQAFSWTSAGLCTMRKLSGISEDYYLCENSVGQVVDVYMREEYLTSCPTGRTPSDSQDCSLYIQSTLVMRQPYWSGGSRDGVHTFRSLWRLRFSLSLPPGRTSSPSPWRTVRMATLASEFPR